MGTGSFPGVKCGRGVLLTTHPLLVPRSWKSRALGHTGHVTGKIYFFTYIYTYIQISISRVGFAIQVERILILVRSSALKLYVALIWENSKCN